MGKSVQPLPWRESRAQVAAVLPRQSNSRPWGERECWLGPQCTSKQPVKLGSTGGRGQRSRHPGVPVGAGRAGAGEEAALARGEGVQAGPAPQVSRGEATSSGRPEEKSGAGLPRAGPR